MYRKILVAVDHSSLRSHLFSKAIDLAKLMKADLMIVHALSAYEEGSPGLPVRSYHAYYPISDSIAWETYQKRWENYEREGINELRQLAAEATDQGIKTEFTQTAGDPGRVICDMAASWQADIIIVGNRGRSGLSEFFLGSVSNYVMHHAPCSVLVVHNAEVEELASETTATEETVSTSA
ncbi:MAG: universal stress protein [Leptolyngbya sp. SIOISBB]|nr:universal stress protein [Leptolyngbya sp. SIOISBB]